MLARILFVLLAATASLGEDRAGCEPHATLGNGATGTLYLTAGFSLYEESNGLPGLQRGCPGDRIAPPDALLA